MSGGDVLDGLKGFTPGPWEAWDELGTVHAPLRPDDGIGTRNAIAGALIIRHDEGDVRTDDTYRANARLIARAPELVEEVKRLREEVVALTHDVAEARTQRDGLRSLLRSVYRRLRDGRDVSPSQMKALALCYDRRRHLDALETVR